ncbi:RluA family pseudouridine synthase [Edhazardia aedis USNM 41457]|uniref:Pseudouridine synthase n=1 Tax=Edhazardia aedis (strain USNM 41457) TaxID=1003232 RepID=J9D0Z7_EDHAE|nr:RluA family pseudouridine synthase [Edhazardia aedis USNM 41457]|eukprot:EJW01249.1 RluA family pseudouridine synthase [Edhazardia aedis USNM 41457]
MKILKYFKTLTTNVKGRWVNKQIIDVFAKEFRSMSRDYYVGAILNGIITVNNKHVPLDYVLKHGDKVRHILHVHEPEPCNIEILYESKDFLVVDKPCGMASHPVGLYYYYTITKALENKYGPLSCINRLDIPTSGVLLISRSNSDIYHSLMRSMKIKKSYFAKVKGNLKDQEVNVPLLNVPCGNVVADKNGKESRTAFRNIAFKDGFSLVECRPFTGRTHQIRVHLKYIGHPIINDPIYGDFKKEKIIGKATCDGSVNIHEKEEIDDIFNFSKNAQLIKDPKIKSFIIKNCECENNSVFRNQKTGIYLHAYTYSLDGMIFKTALPEWVKDFNCKLIDENYQPR